RRRRGRGRIARLHQGGEVDELVAALRIGLAVAGLTLLQQDRGDVLGKADGGRGRRGLLLGQSGRLADGGREQESPEQKSREQNSINQLTHGVSTVAGFVSGERPA